MQALNAELSVTDLNARLEAEIADRMPLGESVLFAGITLAMEESLVFLVDTMVNGFIQQGLLSAEEYTPTVLAMTAALDNIRLRSLYDAVIVIERVTEQEEV